MTVVRRVVCFTGIIFCLLGMSACQPGSSKSPKRHASNALQDLLGSQVSTKGFARAIKPRSFHFPHDYGPHPGYRTEWWYYTGNLQTTQGRSFGFELTVFRFALSHHHSAGDSLWRSNQVYMADFAVSDLSQNHFFAFQHLSRGALGLAGAQGRPFKIWVDNWSVASRGKGFPWKLHARHGSIALSLLLTPRQAVVPNGNHGLSRKGPASGDASYYYSIPRLAAHGQLKLKGQVFRVSGNVWMDHEWSTSALGPNQVGWDWFGLQLNDGADLMFYRLRERNGHKDRFSAGTWVMPNGQVVHLTAGEVHATPVKYWTSGRGVRYPVIWRLSVPKLQLQLKVRARMNDQLLPLAVRYWEGAVLVTGKQGERPVQGKGYLELTGYGSHKEGRP